MKRFFSVESYLVSPFGVGIPAKEDKEVARSHVTEFGIGNTALA
jgi:hypothetical protein